MSFRNLFSSITRSTLLLAFLAPHVARPQATQTISSYPAYQSLRACGQSCFYNEVKHDILGSNLKCCKQQYCADQADEQCYCREDLAPKATSWLSLCIDKRCSSPVDFTSAVNVYDSYCTRNRNVMVSPTMTTPPPTGTATEKPSQTVPTGTGLVTVVVTATSGAPWVGSPPGGTVLVLILVRPSNTDGTMVNSEKGCGHEQH
ncbi:hypothetical protein DM02DRAFT_675849 [Periconia macrospinosa]|uniref:Extracellular membrane protein CFEM domain-containing protein n=1 Tax=Periconia macrospinosa TaxID=97972 RepID=A0A2V1DA21_9PLEO|nr:hypothetical protein DM02DRAFT_675849 [Periconia macrospinosa]